MHHHGHGRQDWQFGRRGFGASGRGFGPFGPNFGGGKGGNFWRAGKMIADGDLRLIALALIAERPRHGYDLIKALEELSSGVYSPSPGVVYPTLTFLEEAGYVTAASDGNKKVYTITEAGRGHLAENRELVDSVMKGIEKFGAKIARAREWFDWSAHGDPRARPDRDMEGVHPALNEARRRLKMAIAEKIGSSPEEQMRVAGILSEAAAAILRDEPRPDTAEAIDL